MSRPTDHAAGDLAEVASESPRESTEAEKEAVGPDEPDVGDTVPPDDAQ